MASCQICVVFKHFSFILILSTVFLAVRSTSELTFIKPEFKLPTVVIAFLARNKAHTLPYFLTLLEGLEYPKSRISLWIRSDHNVDNTIEIIKTWLLSVKNDYHSVNSQLLSSPPDRFSDENGTAHWSTMRFNHVIQLREEALMVAREMWADYIWFLDSDVFITNNQTLKLLVSKNHTISSPMLKSDGLYSNFWCGMTEDYYYQRTDDYKPILNREREGCFHVPMVHSSVIVNLRHASSDGLTFISTKVPDYKGPQDDIITFALSANKSGIPLFICNDHVYGFLMVPLELTDPLSQDYIQLANLKLEILVDNPPLPVKETLSRFVSYREPDTMGFDAVYMINLVRRPERRERMLNCFRELSLDVTLIDAVDGKQLNSNTLKDWDIKVMPEFEDPYHKRPITMGEIGCFLSHFNIWRQVVDYNYDIVMVLEDDIRFESFFRHKLTHIMMEIDKLNIEWDLIYLGRKRLQEKDEAWVPGSQYLVQAGYSYWTLGYLLNQRGARKLLAAKPLENLLPVDEYLPIMFDKHPQAAWKSYFPRRDLIALSAAPLLLYPTHYTGEKGYVSDTEDSSIITDVNPSNLPSVRDDL